MLRLPFVVGTSEWASPLIATTMAKADVVRTTQKRGRRRTTALPIGNPPIWEKSRGQLLDETNRELLTRLHDAERRSFVKAAIVDEGRERTVPEGGELRRGPLTDQQRRVGLVVRKLGMLPQWTNDGDRVLCSILEVPSNHVVSVTSPEEWFRKSMVGKRKAFNRDGPMWKVTVGASDAEAWRYTNSYRAQFARAGVAVKERLGSFLVTENALPTIGSPLDARHFSIGQYVTATGKTIDWGFQGGMHRWGMRGQPQRRTTKSHRRIGSVGSVSDARIWPGKRMPGHMGWEWNTMSGIQIVRMNIDKQVIYVKGCVPGDIGEWILLKDCLQDQKRPKNVCFPTWSPSLETIPEEKDNVEGEEGKSNIESDREVYMDKMFRFASPSILFAQSDVKKQAGRDKTKAKIAKVKK